MTDVGTDKLMARRTKGRTWPDQAVRDGPTDRPGPAGRTQERLDGQDGWTDDCGRKDGQTERADGRTGGQTGLLG